MLSLSCAQLLDGLLGFLRGGRDRGALLWSGALLLLLAGGVAARAPEPFTIVVLPDTQHYADNAVNYRHFAEQVKWIGANREARNIAFVSHVGDLVQNGGRVLEEWVRVDRAMRRIDATPSLPYSAVLGNHDYDVSSNDPSDSADVYLSYFGPERYAGRPWYGGSSPDGRSHWQRFHAGGRTFLHLTLEWRALSAGNSNAAEVGEWAQGVLDAHPTTPVMITTHEYLGASARMAAGEDLFQALVNENPQVFLIVGGHVLGENHRVVANAERSRVYEILANFQHLAEGGLGYLVLLEFDEANDAINVSTYSPSLDVFKPGVLSEYVLGIPFARTLGPGGEAAPIWWGRPEVVEVDGEEAELRAEINQDAAVVKLCWDSEDRGTGSPATWAHEADLPAWEGGAGAIETLVTGLEEGTSYSYRFFASQGLAVSESWSEVGTFIAREATPFDLYVERFGLSGEAALPGADGDHDSLSNLEEFSYGLQPAVPDSGPLRLVEGGGVFRPGTPVAQITTAPLGGTVQFVRRSDHLAAGLEYTVQFSGDLVTWTDSAAAPRVLQQDSATGYEVVEVAYPEANGSTAQFSRVVVEVEW